MLMPGPTIRPAHSRWWSRNGGCAARAASAAMRLRQLPWQPDLAQDFCANMVKRGMNLHRLAGLDRSGERALVEIIELTADRHAMRQARHRDVATHELIGEVMRGGLTLDRGVEREQHLFDARRASALDQLGDRPVSRPHAVEPRERAANHVIEPVEHASALERPEIADLLDHADQRAVAALVPAQRARVDGIDVATGLAGHDAIMRFGERGGERREQLLLLLDEMQRRASGGAGAEARQTCEQLDEALDLGAGGNPRHHPRPSAKKLGRAGDASPLPWRERVRERERGMVRKSESKTPLSRKGPATSRIIRTASGLEAEAVPRSGLSSSPATAARPWPWRRYGLRRSGPPGSRPPPALPETDRSSPRRDRPCRSP